VRKDFLIFIPLFFLLEFYVYQAFKQLTTNPLIRASYWVFTALVYLAIGFIIFRISKGTAGRQSAQWMMSLLVLFVLPKLLTFVFLLFGDIVRFAEYGVKKVAGNAEHLPSRRRFFSVAGLASAGLFSLLMLDGIVFGKYRHWVRHVRIRFAGLPPAFKGYRIVQVSDVHSGTFYKPEKLQHAIDMINRQNADLVLFTGDMVNNQSEEFIPFVELFKSIQARDGKFAVLGNHDYAGYLEWETPEAQRADVENLIRLEEEAGFEMLRNEHRVIERNGEKLYIIGVENWGLPPFPQLGDLNKASEGVPPEAIKILMSHDPSHFDAVVKKHPANVQLTLSGHTHGMQFGIDLKNVKWSPIQYKYPKWADLYESMGKYLYVNRGFGVLGYPGRVGIDPEITVFELI